MVTSGKKYRQTINPVTRWCNERIKLIMKHLEKMILVRSRLSFIKRKIMFQKTFVWCNKDKTLFSSVQIFIHYSNNQLFISSSYIQCTEPKQCFKKGTFFWNTIVFSRPSYLIVIHKLTHNKSGIKQPFRLIRRCIGPQCIFDTIIHFNILVYE